MISAEYSLEQSILSPTYKAVRSFLIVLLVKDQKGTNFNTTRQSSKAS